MAEDFTTIKLNPETHLLLVSTSHFHSDQKYASPSSVLQNKDKRHQKRY